MPSAQRVRQREASAHRSLEFRSKLGFGPFSSYVAGVVVEQAKREETEGPGEEVVGFGGEHSTRAPVSMRSESRSEPNRGYLRRGFVGKGKRTANANGSLKVDVLLQAESRLSSVDPFPTGTAKVQGNQRTHTARVALRDPPATRDGSVPITNAAGRSFISKRHERVLQPIAESIGDQVRQEPGDIGVRRRGFDRGWG